MAQNFFNYASSSFLLKPTVRAMKRAVKENIASSFSQIEKTRRKLADLIAANPDEIAFMANTSMALSCVASSIRWQKGDKVLYLSDEFPSNRYVWDNLEEVKVEAINPDPQKSFLSQLKERDLTGVRLIALSAISYQDGRLFPVSEISKFCQERGILLSIDGVQAVGAIEVDVKKWGCDFLSCGGQKWLFGPQGSGFLYVRKELIPHLKTPFVGWGSQEKWGDLEAPLNLALNARRFETGLYLIPQIIGLGKSLEVLEKYGWKRIYSEIQAKREKLETLFGNEIYKRGPEPLGGGILSVRKRFEGIEATEKIEYTRLSLHAFTRDKELRALKKQKKEKFPFKRVLITGASRGLGAAFAELFGESGCELTLLGRSLKSLQAISNQIGEKCAFQVIDLRDFKALPEGSFDLIINNAAEGDFCLFEEESEAKMRQTFETNFFAPWKILHHYLPHMKEEGAVLNIVTASGRCALPFFSSYQASKAALWTLSETLSREFPHLNICTFIPPHMKTQMAMGLARRAFNYFLGTREKTVSPRRVARMALKALIKKKKLSASIKNKIKVFTNQLFPGIINKFININLIK